MKKFLQHLTLPKTDKPKARAPRRGPKATAPPNPSDLPIITLFAGSIALVTILAFTAMLVAYYRQSEH